VSLLHNMHIRSDKGRASLAGLQAVRWAPDTQATLVENVRVQHRRDRRAHVGMAEQRLNGPDVRIGLEQVRRE